MNPTDPSIFMSMPIVAILRGLTPDMAIQTGEALFAAGIRIMEVPLNSPDAFASIRLLAERFGNSALVGAGTVLTEEQVTAVADAGGRLIVSPDTNPAVIRTSNSRNLVSMPGVFTPTEAFQALRSGAHILKLFPADALGPAGLRALRAVLPNTTKIFAVGGVSATNMPIWKEAGADGMGVGSTLFNPTLETKILRNTAERFVAEWRRFGRLPDHF